MRTRAGIALLLVAAAPAGDLEQSLMALDKADQRVAAIGFRLATRNVERCGHVVRQGGMVFQDLALYDARTAPVAAKLFGLGAYPVVMRSGASGLVRGTAITAVDHVPLGPPDRKNPYARIARIEAAIEAGPVLLTWVWRDQPERQNLFSSAKPGCASRVTMLAGRKLNATSDGTYVQLTSAVVDFAQSDDELAFVIAHEMAHNILNHPDSRKRNAKDVRATEMEADSFALKLMKAADYDPAAAARFWARFGKKTGAGIFSDGTHMPTKARVAFLQAEAAALAQ